MNGLSIWLLDTFGRSFCGAAAQEKLGERSGSSVLIEMKRGELSISVERKDMLSPPSTKVRTSLKTSISIKHIWYHEEAVGFCHNQSFI